MLISKGNLKIGELPSFSLPVVTCCPGKTPFCDLYCYGLKGNFILTNVKEANERRLDASLRNDFVEIITAEILRTRAPAFRLHVVGDFYCVEYIEKWMQIARNIKPVIIFGSTRSWRCDFLWDTLKKFRDLDNVFVKASIDLTDSAQPCTGWNTWSVEGPGRVCPHDEGKVANCYECKRCWSIKNLNVMFRLRWGNVREYMTPLLLTN